VENVPEAQTVQLSLEDIMFPLQEVQTNQGHDPNGDRAGTQLQYGNQIQKLEGAPGRFAVAVSVRTDNGRSKNPPYTFAVEAYAIVNVTGTTDEAAMQQILTTNAFPIIMGAIRERIAHLTGRAPWGRFLINVIPLSPATTISYI
jgi:hypothetical protein